VVITLKRAGQLLTKTAPGKTQAELAQKYAHFPAWIEANHQVLRLMADLEGKLKRGYLFELQYSRATVNQLRPRRGFIEARLAKYSHEKMARRLIILDKLTHYGKQLDQALISDNIVDWCSKDFMQEHLEK
jgi:hypothetical protein